MNILTKKKKVSLSSQLIFLSIAWLSLLCQESLRKRRFVDFALQHKMQHSQITQIDKQPSGENKRGRQKYCSF